jgi:glycosyltransferase involved in cell wall biosynthesis
LKPKASYRYLLSLLCYYVAKYDKALYYAGRSAACYAKSRTVFSSKLLERHIERCTDRVVPVFLSKNLPPRDENRVGILASTIYDVGGHTECLMRFSESFHAEYDLHLFLTNSSGDSSVKAKTKYSYLKTILKITAVSARKGGGGGKVTSLIESILASNVKILFVYMHMDDAVACGVLAYLSKYTEVKIVFFNHGDHAFSLGFESPDLIIELRKQGQFVTHQHREKNNTALIPLQGVKSEKLRSYAAAELSAKRRELGLTADDLVSLSGFASFKVFQDKGNAYLILIKNLLMNEIRCKHILVTEMSKRERNSLRKVFEGSEHLLERLIIIDRVVEFDLLLQVADVFIDSFPLGSALVHIDAIRNKLPTIIKKNSRNELYTFYNYLYEDYEYAVESVEEMLEKILFLLRNKEERQHVAEKCYQHYLDTYEFDIIKSRYKLLIDNHLSLSQFYTDLPVGYICKMELDV